MGGGTVIPPTAPIIAIDVNYIYTYPATVEYVYTKNTDLNFAEEDD